MSSTRSLMVLCVLALSGCDEENVMMDAGMPRLDAGPPGYDAGPITRIPETEAAAGRTSCAFGAGAMPWQTIGQEQPIGGDIPIDHFIILMQENRSFDHYFGTMEGVDGFPDPLPTNPDTGGTQVPVFHTADYCVRDLGHAWNASHREWNGGANDGFLVTNEPEGTRSLGYLDETDLPFYRDLARTFAFSDHHFCLLLGPTWPNRLYFMSGTSFGLIDNTTIPTERVPTEGEYNVLQQLDRVGVSWGVYYAAVPFIFGEYTSWALRPVNRNRTYELPQFFAHLDAGTLPRVTYVDPFWTLDNPDATDEHPPANPQRGQAFVRDIVTRVMASSIWPRTAIILTWDEHGGFYDHVPPPEACLPGDFPPDREAGSEPGDFDRLGFRVPIMVVSPYARRGYVSQQVTDLTSVLRLLQTRYLLPALSGRDANAWPLLDMFDFQSPPQLDVPDLAAATVDEARVAECRAEFPL